MSKADNTYYILLFLILVWVFRRSIEGFSSGPGVFDQLKSMNVESGIGRKRFRGEHTDFCHAPFKACVNTGE